jgi:hypothetical protein
LWDLIGLQILPKKIKIIREYEGKKIINMVEN